MHAFSCVVCVGDRARENWDWPFPLRVANGLQKHIGWLAMLHCNILRRDVKDVMNFQVGLRELYVDVKQGVKMRRCVTRLTRGTSYCHQVASRREIYTY